MTIPYQPAGPYFFQSGKREGRCADTLMFTDPARLRWLLDEMKERSRGGKNKLHLHLEWLFAQGETRKTKMLCPYCKTKPVKFFSVLWSYSMEDFSASASYSACEDAECLERLKAEPHGSGRQELMRFRFSVIERFRLKIDQRRILTVLRDAFELPKKLTAQKAFEFFSE